MPLPLEPPVMWIQDFEVLAVHVQPDWVLTLKLPELLLDPKLWDVGEIE